MTISERARLNVAGHLTCVNASREEVLDVARKYRRMGVRKIVALRGDPPKGATEFPVTPGGFSSAAELVAGLRDVGDFEITVAAYPEKHPEAATLDADITNLKRKIDAGATQAITQFFFDNEHFLRFRDLAAKAGISAPIVPGILPIENFEKTAAFAKKCETSVPDWMSDAFSHANTPEDRELLALSVCADQCDELIKEGVEHLHFYTLNNPDLTYDICYALGAQPAALGIAASTNVA